MSELTTNYNLVKPGYADTADIMDINANMDIIDSAMKGVSDKADGNVADIASIQTSLQDKQNITDSTLQTTNKTVPSAINELVDKSFATWKHDTGSYAISMSGVLSSVGTWIKNNYIANRWIACRVNPTDTTGYYGQSSFTVLACCSSTNYGIAQLMSDNPNKSALVVGQLVGGTWSWKAVNTTAIP